MPLSLEDGRAAVRLARRTLDAHVRGEALKSEELPRLFSEPRGVFVTLNLAGKGQEALRGCIGFPYPTYPLGRAIREATVAAASEDPRFPPVGPGELNAILVEVSILTLPEELKAPDRTELSSKVRVGVDGLIVSDSLTSGLLLPQVATEFGFDSAEFLSQTCLKAGLPPDAWLTTGTRVFAFQADIYAEPSPGGEASKVTTRGP
jgi:uncharacterized protein